MGGLGARLILRGLAAIVSVVAVTWLALWYFIPTPPSTIVMSAGYKDGSLHRIAEHYRERLAKRHVTLDIRFAEGSRGNLKLIEDRNSGVDAVLLFGGVTDARKSPDLISLGRVAYDPMWFFYRGTESLDRISQLKGKRLGASSAFTPVQQVLDVGGINANNTTYTGQNGPPLVKALKDGEVDAIILLAQLETPFIQSLMRDPSVRLMNVTQAEAFTRLLPFLNRLVLPQGVIDPEKNIPANDVNMIATTTTVVVRKTLHPELIYLLAQTLKEEHGGAGVFQHVGDFPTQTDPELPMAEEAVDFYRNGPSFLHRYLPFWMINYAKRVAAILVTIIAIVIPVFSYAPRVYAWFLQYYIEKLYRRLRAVDASLQSNLAIPEIEALRSDLENIGRAAHVLPLRRSSMFFDLMMHIRLTRAELAARLDALRRQAA